MPYFLANGGATELALLPRPRLAPSGFGASLLYRVQGKGVMGWEEGSWDTNKADLANVMVSIDPSFSLSLL